MARTASEITTNARPSHGSAHLDDMHVGDINGGLGTIAQHDTGKRSTIKQRFVTFLAILGPGLIVLVDDNDAGAFGT